jgi:hypothetical protein
MSAESKYTEDGKKLIAVCFIGTQRAFDVLCLSTDGSSLLPFTYHFEVELLKQVKGQKHAIDFLNDKQTRFLNI